MDVGSALDTERCRSAASDRLAKPMLQRASEQDGPAVRATARYQFGEAVLEIALDDPLLLLPFEQLYGECAVSANSDIPTRVRCFVHSTAHPPLCLITFQEGAPPDTAVAALSFLHPPPGDPAYAIRDAELPGWRLVGSATQSIVAASATRVLIDSQHVAEDFLVEYLVSATFEAQPDLLVVHAAALQVGNAGILLAAPSRAGKTTTAAHLAARGHVMLGDELALIRMSNRTIVPLRRCVSFRAGPRSPEFSANLERLGLDGKGNSGGKTAPLRIDALFPASPARPVPLQTVFFLSGFADHPSLALFQPTLNDVDAFNALAANDIVLVSWGLTRTRRALRLMALKHILAQSPCWRLQVGPPVETAELIERTMEEQCY